MPTETVEGSRGDPPIPHIMDHNSSAPNPPRKVRDEVIGGRLPIASAQGKPRAAHPAVSLPTRSRPCNHYGVYGVIG